MDFTARPSPFKRLAYALAAICLLGSLVFELAAHGTGGWQVVAFGIGPDLALLFGAGHGLSRGQLHPRAVGAYNIVHRAWGPLALALTAALGLVPLGYFVGALAWAFHIALDRALGYGLRTVDGFQRA